MPQIAIAGFPSSPTAPTELGSTLHQVRELILATLANHQMNRAITTLQHAGASSLPPSLHPLPQQDQQVIFMTTMPIMVDQRYHSVDVETVKRKAKPQGAQSAGSMIWIISLGFDLEGLGRIVAKGELQGRSLGTDFWAEKEITRLLLDRKLPELAEQLGTYGLNISHLTTHAGLPATPPSDLPPLSLIDISI
ncbi:MAG: flagellar hook-length control protein FliK [Pseudomonadales bacterium]|nr:flagellar hook-length control protein FliK [Pseudomonadales bacterium]